MKHLERLLDQAVDQRIIDEVTSERILRLADERGSHQAVLSVAGVLGWLGGLATALGFVLLVAANWGEIADVVKIVGFLAVLAVVHGLGLWIRYTHQPRPKTADALNFTGSASFIAGVGLIAQIYHLDARPPNGVLVWLIAITPLAVLLQSGPCTALSLFAGLLWVHMEGSFRGSPLAMPRWSFTPHLIVELGLGVGLVGFASFFRRAAEPVVMVLRGSGVLLLFYAVYLMGFYRHFSEVATSGSVVLPVVALLLGGAGLALGSRRFDPGSTWLRNRLIVLLAVVLAVGGLGLGADAALLPRGPELRFFNFGSYSHFDLAGWAISLAAWLVWFGLAGWCVAYGSRKGGKQYVNTGVLAVGLGVITRFFDLIGSMAQTGTLFVVGGLVLLVTGWLTEKWRRRLIGHMETTP